MSRRIVFFATGLGRGGAETQLVRLALGLQERGWTPIIVSMLERNFFEAELEAAGIEYRTLAIARGRPDPRAAMRLLRILRELRPDVFCSFLVAANTIGRPVARLARVPVIVSSVRTPVLKNAKREWMLRLSRPFHDAVVFNSQTVAEDAIARGLVPAAEVQIIRNGLSMDPFDAARSERKAVRAELGIGPDEFLWLVVGHLRPEKNYPTLVQAFRALRERYRHVRLVSAGGLFQDHDRVRELIPELLADGTVQLLGVRRDVPRLLAAADAFVLASHYDASPNGLIEALASRLPAVATRVGGVPEIVTGDDVGLLAPTPGLADLTEAMTRLMEMTPAERQAMGDAGRVHAERQYGRVRMIDEWEGLFDRLLQTSR